MLTRSRSTTSSRVLAICAGLGMAAAAAPSRIVPIGFAVLAIFVTTTNVARPRLAWIGGLVALAALAVIGVTPEGAITVVASVALGAGVGLTLPDRERLERTETTVVGVCGVA